MKELTNHISLYQSRDVFEIMQDEFEMLGLNEMWSSLGTKLRFMDCLYETGLPV